MTWTTDAPRQEAAGAAAPSARGSAAWPWTALLIHSLLHERQPRLGQGVPGELAHSPHLYAAPTFRDGDTDMCTHQSGELAANM